MKHEPKSEYPINIVHLALLQKPLHPQQSKKQYDNTKATKTFDYTMIADRLIMGSWSNDSHSSGVVKPVQNRRNCCCMKYVEFYPVFNC